MTQSQTGEGALLIFIRLRRRPRLRAVTPACLWRFIEALRRAGTALAVEECITLAAIVTAIDLLGFGGFRQPADDPPKPWRLRTEALQRPGA